MRLLASIALLLAVGLPHVVADDSRWEDHSPYVTWETHAMPDPLPAALRCASPAQGVNGACFSVPAHVAVVWIGIFDAATGHATLAHVDFVREGLVPHANDEILATDQVPCYGGTFEVPPGTARIDVRFEGELGCEKPVAPTSGYVFITQLDEP